MNSPKKAINFAALTVICLWVIAPLSGKEGSDFLSGKVYDLDKPGLSFADKLNLAEKEFKKTGAEDAYFTAYTFLSRHNVRFDGRHSSRDAYKIVRQDDKINIRRSGGAKNCLSRSINSQEGSELAGILLLHKKVRNKSEIVDSSILDLDRTYEVQEAPVYWLGDVDVEQSRLLLEDSFESGSINLRKDLIFLISAHQSPKTLNFLKRVALGTYENKIRENAIFWIGNDQGSKSLGILKEIYKKEQSVELRKQVVFALQLSDQKEALNELIDIAKTEKDRAVRKSAIFWLGQKASEESIRTLKDIVDESDSDKEVKEAAVFAISQLPEENTVPVLIDIARTNKSPSVRKNAIFWLGQTGSKEALTFFEEILFKQN
ncbi:HEAT repeat domain-containing protein [Acidobacteriota bacterium]